MSRVVLFGDDYGVPQLLRHVPVEAVVAIVGAASRPAFLDELSRVAESIGVACIVQPRLRDPGFHACVDAIAALAPDCFFVDSYAMKLPPELLALATRRAVNLHAALLPQYRGPNPIQWAILDGEVETGVTLHHMTDTIDAGDIIAQARVPIEFDDTWRDVQHRLKEASERVLAEQVPNILAGSDRAIPQDGSAVRVHHRRGPEDGRFDWDMRVLDIYNLIRALVEPLPGAFVEEAGGRRWFREYHTLSEVTTSKFGVCGPRRVATASVHLLPVRTSGAAGNRELLFDIVDRSDVAVDRDRQAGARLGGARLHELNWGEASATLSLRAGVGPSLAWVDEVAARMREFALGELGLPRVEIGHAD